MAKGKEQAKQKPSALPRQATAVLSLLLVIGALVFFAPFMSVIAISALLAYTFLPLYKYFRKKMPDVLAAWSVILVAFLAVIVPMVYIGVVVLEQSVHVISALSNSVATEGSQLNKAIDYMVGLMSNAGDSGEGIASALKESVVGFVGVVVPSVLGFFVDALLGLAASLPIIITSVTIFAFLFSVMLRKHEEIGRFLYDISPLDKGTTGMYLQRSSDIVLASLRGQLLLSLMSGTLSALLLIVLGYGEYFWFMVVLFTLLGMIPAGSGIVVIPICAIYMLSQDFWVGFWVLMVYLVIIGNSETVVRPKLIPKNIDLIPALTILSVFCGIYYFGIMGVVYGPLIVILLSTTADILIHQKKVKASNKRA